MCFSAQASFTAAALLTAGGIYCLRKARPLGKAYLPLALFPLIVGIQQTAEGLVWTGFALENRSLIFTAALSYLFFVWMVWPVWVPYMTARLEPGRKRRTFFYTIAAIGILLGLQFYLPLFQGPEWFDVVIKNHSISYQCKLITQPVLPRYSLYLTYLTFIALAPILSSHLYLRLWGICLTLFVPVTFFFYRYADISVLCFFAAIMTLYVIYIVHTEGKDARQTDSLSREIPT